MKTEKIIKKVQENGCLQLELPEFSNQRVEIEISLVGDSEHSEALVTLHEESGFLQTVLADKSEDVWNDL